MAKRARWTAAPAWLLLGSLAGAAAAAAGRAQEPAAVAGSAGATGAAAAAPRSGASGDTAVALVGGRVHPVNRPPIERGVVILSGGVVRAVGDASTPVPDGARVIDCRGKVVTPGLIDAATLLGVSDRDANEQGEEVTPQVRILDAVDPDDPSFRRARRAGVTTVQVSPGNRNVIGGLGAVLKTAGSTVRDMLLRDESCLRVTLGSEPSEGNRPIRGGVPDSIYYRRPTTRMGVVWEVRQAFYDAEAYREERTLGAADGGIAPDPGLEVLLRALDGKLQVRTTARAKQDIRTALRLAEEFGYETVVEAATEAYFVASELAAAKVKVVVGAPGSDRGDDGAEPRLHTLNVLAAEQVPFAIATGARVGELSLAQEAMFAVRNGLDPERALAAITLVPAQILGVADRVGTLEAGKDADVVIWTRDPFDPTAVPSAVLIDGEEVQ